MEDFQLCFYIGELNGMQVFHLHVAHSSLIVELPLDTFGRGSLKCLPSSEKYVGKYYSKLNDKKSYTHTVHVIHHLSIVLATSCLKKEDSQFIV